MARRTAWCALCAASAFVALVSGCAAPARDSVLRFFFDGVPAPRTAAPRDTVTRRAAADTTAPAAPVWSEHPPYAERECGACHEQTASNRIDRTSALCFTCHDGAAFAGAVVHAPVASGDCVLCHSPHSSQNPTLLRQPVPRLCGECHTDGQHVQEMLAEKASCTDCHAPHISGAEHLLKS